MSGSPGSKDAGPSDRITYVAGRRIVPGVDIVDKASSGAPLL